MRRSGNTTRNIDKAVQKFFKMGVIFVPNDREIKQDYPHLRGTGYHPARLQGDEGIVFIDGESFNEQVHFLVKFLNRLSAEHSMVYSGDRMPINKLIRIKDFKNGKRYVQKPNLWRSIGDWLGMQLLMFRIKRGLWK